jgi:hypothetical protein
MLKPYAEGLHALWFCCSYWDIMLKPLLEAANKAFKDYSGKTFHFAMGGASYCSF